LVERLGMAIPLDYQSPPPSAAYLPLPDWAVRTFRYHLAFSVLEAAAAGILANVPMMALKGLHAKDWQLTVPLTIASLGMFAGFLSGLVMSSRRKMPFVVVPGLLYALCAMCMAAAGHPLVFLIVFGLGSCFDFVMRPAIAAIMRLNYPVTHRGAVAGRIRRWAALVFLIGTMGSARLLDHFAGAERWCIVALMSLAGIFILAAYACFGCIRVREARVSIPMPRPSIARELARSIHIVEHDRRFRSYLMGFFLFAFSGLMYAAIIPLFLKENLHCGYTSVALLLDVIPSVTSFLVMPRLGAWFDRENPWLTWAMVRLGWGLDPLILAVTTVVWPIVAMPLAIVARMARGSAMGGSWVLSWQIGVNHFAPPGADTSRYMGVQILMNGIVRLIAPTVGAIILTRSSPAMLLRIGGTGVLLSAAHAAWHVARERRTPSLQTMASFERSFVET